MFNSKFRTAEAAQGCQHMRTRKVYSPIGKGIAATFKMAFRKIKRVHVASCKPCLLSATHGLCVKNFLFECRRNQLWRKLGQNTEYELRI